MQTNPGPNSAQIPATTFIITRPKDDSANLVAQLSARGLKSVTAPLLEIGFLSHAKIPRRDYQAVIITSANGARAIASRQDRGRLTCLTAIVIGPASALAARQAGFGEIIEAGGDVAAVMDTVRQTVSPDAGPLLYASGAVTTGEIARDLATSGFSVERCILYQAVPTQKLSKAAHDALQAGKCAILLYSPRTARLWCERLASAGMIETASRSVYFCLSRNVARVISENLEPPVESHVATRPDEQSLLSLIDNTMENTG